MSFPKKKVLNYSKSLFQNARALPSIPELIKIKAMKDAAALNLTHLETLERSESKLHKSVFLQTTSTPIYQIGEELRLRSAMIQNSPSLQAALKNISQYKLTKEQKLKLIIDLFPSVPPKLLLNFFSLLAEKNELELVPEISTEYNNLIFAFETITPIALISATPFQFDQGLKVFNTLKQVTSSKEIIVTGGYKKSLLGGLVLEYKSCSIDASVFKEFTLFFNEI